MKKRRTPPPPQEAQAPSSLLVYKRALAPKPSRPKTDEPPRLLVCLEGLTSSAPKKPE